MKNKKLKVNISKKAEIEAKIDIKIKYILVSFDKIELN